MFSHEEERGEIGHAWALRGASRPSGEARQKVADIGVEAFELLGQRLVCEMRAFRQDGCVSRQIVGEGEPALILRKSV